MRRAVLLGVVLLGLVLVGAFLLVPGSKRSSPARTTGVLSGGESPRGPAELSTPELPSEEPASRRPVAIEHEAVANSDSIRLSGTVVVVDENGNEHPAEDGDFSLWTWIGHRADSRKVAVRRGSWTCDLVRETESGAVDAVGGGAFLLGGRIAVVEEEQQRVPLPIDGPLALRVRWPSRSLLRVRDRVSGRELDPVILVEVDSWPESEFELPPLDAPRRNAGPSPAELPDIQLWKTLFAGSPGYAWGRIQLEASGGERFLDLDPGGDLGVIVSGAARDPAAKLHIYDSTEVPLFEAELGPDGSTVWLEGLVPGHVSVRAEIGAAPRVVPAGVPWSTPRVLGEVATEVTPGSRTTVRLAVEAAGKVERVPLAGSFVLPAEWGLTDFRLDFHLLEPALGGEDGGFRIKRSDMTVEPGSADLFHWSAGEVQPGHYHVALRELLFHVVLSVDADGMGDARIEVPPPAEVAVQCVDARTGLDVACRDVEWISAMPEGVLGIPMEPAKWNEDLHRWTFRAPTPVVDVYVIDDDLQAYDRFEVHPGHNEVLLRVETLHGITLILHDGSKAIPWPNDAFAELSPLDGQEGDDAVFWAGGGRRFTVHMAEPGLYTLKIAEIQGYEPVPAEVVRIELADAAEHVIELRRKP